MAKPKFTLTLAPTFKAKVNIPIPGADAIPVEFTFKGRTREAFKDFIDNLKNREDVDLILEMCSGWELEDAFDKDNIATLALNYLGAPTAILDKYLAEMNKARLGN
jgi:Phage tail assembly chaperone